MIFFRIFRESLYFAVHALTVNKLRTILSLLGVTIGIFTIITVFTIVDSLERNIRDSVSELGSNVVYVQKMPWGAEGGEYKWWKYFQRPEPDYRELLLLQKRVSSADAMAFAFGLNTTLKYYGNSVENATVIPVSHEYYDIWSYDLAEGRYFSEMESKSGPPIAVLGADIAEGLFGVQGAIGKEIKMLGRKVRVIGVFEKQGQSLVGQDVDASVLIPVNFARTLMNLNDRNGAFIMAAAKPGVDMVELKDELRGAMRSIRKLKPKADDNFALNEISVISNGLDIMFSIIGAAGAIIGGFSILVGGFGIANIMFVSVRERTNQIGIQKSLGAKNYFILLQFLLESVVLCLVGGCIGLLAVYTGILIAGSNIDFNLSLSLANVFQGIGISVLIGVISGFIPAWIASRLNPVDAIRMGQ